MSDDFLNKTGTIIKRVQFRTPGKIIIIIIIMIVVIIIIIVITI